MPNALLVLTTMPDEESAARLAESCVREHLCACVNLLPRMRSFYEWKGEAKSDTEHLLLFKTTSERYAALEASILSQHPYELPEIVVTPIVRGLADYLNWIGTQTQA